MPCPISHGHGGWQTPQNWKFRWPKTIYVKVVWQVATKWNFSMSSWNKLAPNIVKEECNLLKSFFTAGIIRKFPHRNWELLVGQRPLSTRLRLMVCKSTLSNQSCMKFFCAPVHVYLSFCAKWFQHPRCFHKWWDSSTLFCNQLDPNVVSHNPKSKTYWHFNDEKPPEAYVAWVVVAGSPAQSPLDHESHLGLLRWISMQGNTALDGPVLSGTSDNQHHALGEENPPQWCWPTQWVLCTVGRLEQPSCANQWSWFD